MVKLPNKIWIGWDWAQAELVFLALYSKDTHLKTALESGDVHRFVASQVFEITEEEVMKEQRDLAKIVSYGLIYSGFNIHTTVANIRRDKPELKEDYLEDVLKKYAETFFQLFEWVNKAVLNWYDEDGYVTYFMGAKKHLPVPDYLKRDLEKLVNHKSGRTAINIYGQQSVGLLLKYCYSNMFNDDLVRKHVSQHIPIFDSMNMLCDIHHLKDVIERIEHYATPILRHEGFEMQMSTSWKSSAISWGAMEDIEVQASTEEPIIYEW